MKNLNIYIDELPGKILDFWHQNLSIENREINRLIHTPIIQWLPYGNKFFLACKKTNEELGNDYNKVVYEISSDLYWEDGYKVTSEDFYFWWEIKTSRFNTKGDKSPWIDSRIEILNENKFSVIFNPIYPFYDINDTLIAAPKHRMFEDWQMVKNLQMSAEDFFSSSYPLSNGKYKILSVNENEISLRLNEFNRDLYLENIYEYITFKTNFDEISVDKSDKIILTNKDEIKTQLKKNTKFNELVRENNYWFHIEFNCYSNNIFSNKELRKAIQHSIDIDSIVKKINKKEIRRVDSFIYDKASIYTANHKRFDVESSKNILKELGYKKRSDNYLYDNKGEKLTIRLFTLADVPFIKTTCEMIKNNLQKIGVNLIIYYLEFQELFSDELMLRGENNTYDLILNFWRCNPIFEKGEMYASVINNRNNIPTLENNYSGYNISGYSNSEYDELFSLFNDEVNERNRQQLLLKMSENYLENNVAISLFQKSDLFFASTSFDNLCADAFTQTVTWNFCIN